MYLFYVDESGTLDPTIRGTRTDGTEFDKDHLYVLVAVSLFESRWHGFEKTLNRRKWELIDIIQRTNPGLPRLELAECEIKSTWTRIPKERKRRRFLASITEDELTNLVDLFYRQLQHHNMSVFAVVVDKRYLHDYLDSAKMHRKAWELLLERIEMFLRAHRKHQGILITDDIQTHRNRSLAMKHAYIQSEGTASGIWLTKITEMPLFVRSELSNGVQLADLVAYNVYRCFRDENPEYPFFDRILPFVWNSQQTPADCLDGLWVFPAVSPLRTRREQVAMKRASRNTTGPG